MKTYYFLKSTVPYLFLPLAPGVVQVELARQGLLANGPAGYLAFFMQIVFTLGIIVFLSRAIHAKNDARNHAKDSKAFVKMSCVSKKVFHGGAWMSVERYLAENHNVHVSHGMTPEESEEWLRESEEFLRDSDVHLEKEPAGERILAGN